MNTNPAERQRLMNLRAQCLAIRDEIEIAGEPCPICGYPDYRPDEHAPWCLDRMVANNLEPEHGTQGQRTVTRERL